MRIVTAAVLCLALTGGVADEEGGKAVTMDRLTPAAGSWWYRMGEPGGGETQGYAHLAVTRAEGGALSIAWEMKLAYPGGTYEEERTMALDASRRLVGASFVQLGQVAVEARREGERWVVLRRQPPDAKPERLEKDLPEDALAGMGFVLAAWMPQEIGATLVRADVNEAKAMEPEGSVVVKCIESEVLPGENGGRFAWRYVLRRRDGREMPIWVSRERAILRVDWGGGLMMDLSPTPTKDLFRQTPPAVVEVPSGPDKLVVRGEFPDVTPERMFALWSQATEIVKWWPPKAEIEPEVGGKFDLSWPEENWFLRGKVTVLEPGKRFGFTWRWLHEKADAPAREVLVEMAPREGGGTVLTITHGPYGEGEAEAKERAGHLAGWQYFAAKLRKAR